LRIAIDTNILAYAEGINGDQRKLEALGLLGRLRHRTVVLPTQVLSELFLVLIRKARWPRDEARNAVLGWCQVFPSIDTSQTVIEGALDLATRHNLNLWDGVVLASAAESGCRLLLTEDLQEGFAWRGVTVTNPFGKAPSALLTQALQ
jgi:predicted nucleic acid-binding protein